MSEQISKITKKYKEKLFPYQFGNVSNIIRIIESNNSVLDASDTGTGKTFTAVVACVELKLRPIIICPKAIISNWKKVCKMFDLKPFFIVNYETLKYGKYYNDKGIRKICPYINYDKDAVSEINNDENENEDESKIKITAKINLKSGGGFTEKPVEKKNIYTWNIPKKEKIIFIFDEVHKCTNFDTFNGQLLLSAKDTGYPILILSATLADKPDKIKMFSYVLNFIDRNIVEKQKINFSQYMKIMDNWLNRDITPMVRIHNMLYPDRATRMRIDAIPNFPETQIVPVAYNINEKNESEIQKEYENIANLLDELKEKKSKDKANILVAVLRAHQKIELLKIPLFVELTRDFLNEGRSVVIFVNFTQTLKTLAKMLDTRCLIYGEQTAEEREINIQEFQDNIEKIIICNIMAGSVGISLHDLHGGHPRISLISPTFSCTNLIQAFGRIHRAGAKSKSLQRIVYVANTVEERICDKLAIKIKDLNSLNNGDLDLTNISFDRR
jgi:superfamily II DNA or RNA helicase